MYGIIRPLEPGIGQREGKSAHLCPLQFVGRGDESFLLIEGEVFAFSAGSEQLVGHLFTFT